MSARPTLNPSPHRSTGGLGGSTVRLPSGGGRRGAQQQHRGHGRHPGPVRGVASAVAERPRACRGTVGSRGAVGREKGVVASPRLPRGQLESRGSGHLSHPPCGKSIGSVALAAVLSALHCATEAGRPCLRTRWRRDSAAGGARAATLLVLPDAGNPAPRPRDRGMSCPQCGFGTRCRPGRTVLRFGSASGRRTKGTNRPTGRPARAARPRRKAAPAKRNAAPGPPPLLGGATARGRGTKAAFRRAAKRPTAPLCGSGTGTASFPRG